MIDFDRKWYTQQNTIICFFEPEFNVPMCMPGYYAIYSVYIYLVLCAYKITKGNINYLVYIFLRCLNYSVSYSIKGNHIQILHTKQIFY